LGGGLAVGLMYTPSIAIVSHYFKRHRPLAMGIVVSGTALGAVIHPIMLNKLFYSSLGFSNTVRVAAALNTVLLLIGNLLMKTRLPPDGRQKAIPFKTFTRDIPYLFQLLGGMLLIFGITLPVFFLQLFSVLEIKNAKLGLYSLPIMNAAGIIGRVLPPAFAPKFGAHNLLVVCTLGMAVMIFSLLGVRNIGGLLTFALLYGFFDGGNVSLIPAVLASLSKDLDELGSRIGLGLALAGLCGLFSSSIIGALLRKEAQWTGPIVFAGSMMTCAVLCFTLSRCLLIRRKKTSQLI